MEDSQSSASASSNRVTTPPPLTPCRRPAPGKRMHYGPNKSDAIEEQLLKIIEKPENSLMKMKYFELLYFLINRTIFCLERQAFNRFSCLHQVLMKIFIQAILYTHEVYQKNVFPNVYVCNIF